MSKDNNFFTHFGFKNVKMSEKAKLVKDVFDSVSSKYDIMNDIMSMGVHRIWKHELISMLNPSQTHTLLDVGGGTADIPLSFLRKGGTKCIVVDINYEMLKEGLKKALNHGYTSSIDFITADAEHLPFKNEITPCYSISFCIRNVTNINNALLEAYRVLEKGGKFFCLEFSTVNNPILSKAYDVWSFKVIPHIGKYIAKNQEAYEYLVESIRKFPPQEEFANMIRNAGFKNVGFKNLSGGIATIHYGEK